MKAIHQTKKWLKEFVIDLNICPFAKRPYLKGLIRIQSTPNCNDDNMLSFFVDELALLELNLRTDLSTSLLVFPNFKESFEDFNDFSGICDQFLINAKLNDEFQLVVFHPSFYFSDSNLDDTANMVGQSPWPTIHIIRNIDIEEASLNYKNIDLIPENNRNKILKMFSNKNRPDF